MTQWATRLQTMGVWVSPAPRMVPVETPWRPSKSWKAAATSMRVAAVAITEGSVVNREARGTGQERHHGAGAGHEGHAQGQRGPAGVAGDGGLAAAQGLADADGAGGGEAEGDHEGHARDVEDDVVGGQGHRVERAGQGGGRGEDADLEGHVHGGGQADGQEPGDLVQVRAERDPAQAGAMAELVARWRQTISTAAMYTRAIVVAQPEPATPRAGAPRWP